MAMFVLILITRPWAKRKEKEKRKEKRKWPEEKEINKNGRGYSKKKKKEKERGFSNLQEGDEPSRPWVSRRSTSLCSEH
ncbi:hypothetical protein I7I48_06480 [Histoplasma ohiense]|nr:hypothetical protein I7I48_06480 [Histoplasma ohiense (nom. inval.)]